MPGVVPETPPRPDVGSGAEPRVLVYALIAAILGFVGVLAAWRSLGWFPPRHAALILLAPVMIAFAIGIVVGRFRREDHRPILGVGIAILALLAPIAMARLVPGVKQPTETRSPDCRGSPSPRRPMVLRIST
jgi:hypothetical protein